MPYSVYLALARSARCCETSRVGLALRASPWTTTTFHGSGRWTVTFGSASASLTCAVAWPPPVPQCVFGPDPVDRDHVRAAAGAVDRDPILFRRSQPLSDH